MKNHVQQWPCGGRAAGLSGEARPPQSLRPSRGGSIPFSDTGPMTLWYVKYALEGTAPPIEGRTSH